MDWMDEANVYRDLIMTNIEYDILCERYGEERMDEVVELMLEAVISKRPYIRIAGDEFPREIVKSRLLKVGPMRYAGCLLLPPAPCWGFWPVLCSWLLSFYSSRPVSLQGCHGWRLRFWSVLTVCRWRPPG